MELAAGEITKRGFITLNEMEAQDNDGDTEDLWITLNNMGYNKALEMDEVCGCYNMCVLCVVDERAYVITVMIYVVPNLTQDPCLFFKNVAESLTNAHSRNRDHYMHQPVLELCSVV